MESYKTCHFEYEDGSSECYKCKYTEEINI